MPESLFTPESVAGAAYLVAALLFILSLAGLSKHESARNGVVYGMIGMAVALAATIWLTFADAWGEPSVTVGLVVLVVTMLIGGAIGLWRARIVQMTGMPELIALLHSFVGLAAVLVGWNGALEEPHLEGALADELAKAADSARNSIRSRSRIGKLSRCASCSCSAVGGCCHDPREAFSSRGRCRNQPRSPRNSAAR